MPLAAEALVILRRQLQPAAHFAEAAGTAFWPLRQMPFSFAARRLLTLQQPPPLQ